MKYFSFILCGFGALALSAGNTPDADAILASPPPIRAEIGDVMGAAGIRVNGKPVTGLGFDAIVNAYCSDAELRHLLHDAGFSTARFLFALGESMYGLPYGTTWTGPGQYDWSYLDGQLARIREANPDARILLKVALDGSRWWCRKNPEHTMTTPDGVELPDYLSGVWRRDAREALRQLAAHIQSSPYREMVIGYTLFNGKSLDCNWEQSWTTPAALAGFRAFLQHRYVTDEALQNAWQDVAVTLATATPQADYAAGTSRYPLLFAPAEHRRVADTEDFQAQAYAQFIVDFAQTIKSATHNQALVGVRHGSTLTGNWGYAPDGNNPLGSARVREYLQDVPVDFLDLWPSYPGRDNISDHGFYAPTQVTTGLGKMNKILVYQNDVRTHVGSDKGYGATPDLRSTVNKQKAAFAGAMTQGQYPYLWQMDYKFDVPELMPMWQAMSDIFERSLYTSRKSGAETAFVVDMDMARYLGRDLERQGPTRGFALIDYPRFNWGRFGAAYDMIFLDQVKDSAYKVYVFFLTTAISDAEREVVHATMKANHATAIFLWCDGLIDGTGALSLANMSRLTGMEMAIAERPLTWQMTPTATLLEAGFDPAERLGVLTVPESCDPQAAEYTFAPAVYVPDPAVTILGCQAETQLPSLVEKTHDGWTAIYSTSPILAPGVLRYALRQAGGQEYMESSDTLFLNESFIGFNTRRDTTEVRLHFPEATALYEVFRDVETAPARNFQLAVEPENTYLYFRGSKADWEKLKPE